MAWRQHASEMSAAELKDAREQFDENRRRAAAAVAARQQRDRELAEKKQAEEKERIRNMREHHALLAREILPPEPPQPLKHPSSRKRSVPFASPLTVAAQPATAKRVPASKIVARPMFQSTTESRGQESFVTTALREGPCEPVMLDPHLTRDAMRDGSTILRAEGGYCTKAGDDCEWYGFAPWQQMAGKISCAAEKNDKISLQSDGGLGLNMLGSGTFNAVFEFSKPSPLPDWIPKDCAIRVTRPDKNSNKEHKYQTISMVSKEAHNALFSAQNGFGVPIYAVSGFHGVRSGRTLRYGTVYALQKADCDLYRALERAPDFDTGARIAVDITELVFRASRCGVAFYDIKPGNILRAKDSEGNPSFKLCDFDSAFFQIVPDVDWRTLMLINLALLSAHVRNGMFGEVGAGWATAVKAVLRDLLTMRGKIDNEWLFKVRSVVVDIDTPDVISPFAMGQMLASMSTSYFYGDRLIPEVRSVTWGKWEKNPHQAQLDAHWSMTHRRSSWPPEWADGCSFTRFTPLIQQLVDFATERARV